MPVMVIMEWKGVTPDQYNAARQLVNWESDPPDGAMLHIAAFDGKKLRITDVWRSKGDFDSFIKSRLLPGMKPLNIKDNPDVEIHDVLSVFAPAYMPRNPD